MNDIEAYYALTRKAFDFLAPVYNVMTLPLIRIRNHVVDFAHLPNGSRVLDVATGTGQQAFAFAKRGYKVIGVDITESMLEIARRHSKTTLIDFQRGDATQLQFEDNTFDLTCVSFALHDMPLVIRQRVLQELRRVTKGQGIITIVDYDLPHNKIGKILMYRLITLYEGEYYKQFIASDLDALLEETGIHVTERHSVLLGCVRILKGSKTIR